MKRMKKYLSMAALALVGAVMTGCSNNDNAVLPVSYDNVQQPVNNEKIVTLKTTISLDNNNATTRALAVDFDQKKAIKTFAVGDKIAISYYSNTSGEFVKAVSEELEAGDITNGGKNATFTVTLDNPDKTKAVNYVYPAAMLNDDLTPNYDALFNHQDGTLTKLGSTFDYCLKQGDWVGENLPSLTLENRLAILAITLKDNAATPAEITDKITSMVVSDGANAYTVNRTAAAGPIYVAILPTSGATIDVIATDGTNYYAKSLANKTYEVSKGYNVTWLMPEVADLSMLDCAGNLRPRSWTANCYMVHSAGDYKLPLVYGNAIKNGATNAAAYTGVPENVNTIETFPRHDGNAITAPWIKDNGITVTTAELLWQDAEGLITNVDIDGDYLTLTVGKNADTQEGNAVVAAKDGSGNIVWSWHIWVTKQTFANLTSVNTFGSFGSHTYQVTPVNLGWVGDAVSQGYNTFYQWGRKDAFIPGTGTANTNHTVYNISNAPMTGLTHVQDNNNTITIADNIKNPTTFYNVSDNYKPNTSTAYNLWDAQQTSTGNIATATKKTVYDPCPAGFCVPTGNLYYYIANGGVIYAWDGTKKGRNLTSVSPNVFFPASGARSFKTGNLGNVGINGIYWSASPYSSNSGRSLSFTSSSWTWSYSYRALGFPVRPVAEE